MKKRILSLLLAFVMTLGLAVPAFAAEAPEAPAGLEEPEAPVPEEPAEEPAPAAPAEEVPVVELPVEQTPAEPIDEPELTEAGIMPMSVEQVSDGLQYDSDSDVYVVSNATGLSAAIGKLEQQDEISIKLDASSSQNKIDNCARINIGDESLEGATKKKVTLDLNGTELNFSSGFIMVRSTSELVINGTGKITSTQYAVVTNNNATVTMNGGEISGKQASVLLQNGSQMTIKGGTVTGGQKSEGYLNPGVQVQNGCLLTVSGGEVITGTDSPAVVIMGEGSNLRLTENGKITAKGTNVGVVIQREGTAGKNGTFTMDGGTITADAVAVNANGGENNSEEVIFDMSGGKITHATETQNASSLVILVNGVMNLSGSGTITSDKVAVGIQIGAPNVEGKEPATPVPGTLNMTGGSVNMTAAGSIGIHAMVKGTNVAISNGSVKGGEAGVEVYENAVGTISGTDTKVEGRFGAVAFSGGELTISNGTITGTDVGFGTNGSDKQTDKTTINVTGGTISGCTAGAYLPAGVVTVSGGSISGQAGIVVRGGQLTVEGGTVEASDGADIKIGDAKKEVTEGEPQRYDVPAAAITVDENSKYPYQGGSATIKGGNIIAPEGHVLAFTKEGVTGSAATERITVAGGYYSASVADFAKEDKLTFELYAPDATGANQPYSYAATADEVKDEAKEATGGQYTDLTTGKVYKYYTVTAEPEQGTIIFSEGYKDGKAFAGDTVSFTVQVNPDYALKSVTVTGVEPNPTPSIDETTGTATYTFTMPTSDVTISTEFEQIPVVEPGAVIPPAADVEINDTEIEGQMPTNSFDFTTGNEAADGAIAEMNKEAAEKAEAAVKETETINEALAALKEQGLIDDDAGVTDVSFFPSTEIKTTGVDFNENTKTLKMDITAYFQLVATKNDITNPNDVVLEGNETTEKPVNAVKVGEAVQMTISTPIQLTVPVPTALADAGKLVYIKHTHTNEDQSTTVEVTTSTVKVDGNGIRTVTFTVNGLSELELTSDYPGAAAIGSKPYDTLQKAVDDVKAGKDQTITVYKVYPSDEQPVKLIVNGSSTGKGTFNIVNAADVNNELHIFHISSSDPYNYNVTYKVDETSAPAKLVVTVTKITHSGGSSGSTTVDKTELEKAIAKAEALKEADYTADSWAALEKALTAAKAVEDDATATRTEVNNAVKALQDTMDALVKAVPEVDKSALEASIAAAEALSPEDYTEETFAAVETALAAAKDVAADEDATQDEVDAAQKALDAAVDALVPAEAPEVDKSDLEAAIAEAEALNPEDYTEESWAAVQEALEAAKAAAADADATQEDVDAAQKALDAAVGALVPAEEPDEVDKTALEQLIAVAETVDEADCTPESWAFMAEALEVAKAVYADPDAPQEDVDAAVLVLFGAIMALEPAASEPPAPPASGTGWMENESGIYFYKDGQLKKSYWVGKVDGASKWDGNWYYVDANGKLLTGMQYLDDLHGGMGWYFLQPTNANGEIGKMLTGWQWVGGEYGTGWFSTKNGSAGKCTYTTELGDWNGSAWVK